MEPEQNIPIQTLPPQTPPELPNQNNFFWKILSDRKIIFPFLCLIFLIIVSLLYYLKIPISDKLNGVKNSVNIKTASAAAYFSVVSVTPSDNSSNNPEDTSIKITFSEPVKPDSLRSFFTVSPMIPGDFSQGNNPNEVVFKSKYPYGPGTSVKVILNKGFESISGDKFTYDYSFNFFTKIPDKSVLFENDSIFSKWANLTVGKDITFNLHVGSDVSSDGIITIYKGTEDAILSSLIYGNETHTDSNYVTQTYKNQVIDTSKMEKISDTTGLKDGSPFHFSQGEGLYYIEAKSQGDVVGSTWINVTDQGLIIRQDDQKLTVATQNIKTGDINSTVKVNLYNLQSKQTLIKSQTITSYGEIPVEYPQTVDLVVGETDHGLILVPLSIPETQADIRVNSNLSNLDKIYLYTDRPTYAVGDKVYFRGIYRKDNDAKYTLPGGGEKIHIWIADPKDGSKNIIEQTATVGDGGIFYGQFIVPKSLLPDGNSIFSATLYAKEESDTAKYNSSISYSTFDVIDKGNKVILSVSFDKNNYTNNETVTAHISGLDSLGKPLSNKPFTYTVYSKNYYENDPASVVNFGTDWGEPTKATDVPLTLDNNGQANVQIQKDDNNVSEEVTLEATMDSEGGSIYGAKTALIQQGKIVLTFAPSRSDYHSGDTTITRVYAKDLSGNVMANFDLTYLIYKSQYDNSTSTYKETTLRQGSTKTDNNGFAIIKEPVITDPGNIAIRVMAKDDLGNNIQGEQTMSILQPGANFAAIYYHNLNLNNFDVSADKLSYNVGDTANLVINTPFDQNVLVTYESGRIYHNEWLTLKKGDNNYQIPVSEDLFPSFNIVFSYFNNQNLVVEGLPFTVNDNSKNLAVTAISDKDSYTATNSAQILITTKNNNGQPVSAKVSLDVIDDSIFNLRDNLPAGNLGWFFYSPKTVKTNFSASTLGIGTGGGCGGGSGLEIKYVPNRLGDNIYWDPNITTDQNGQAVINIPIANLSAKLRILTTASTDNLAVGKSKSTILVK